MTGIPRPALVLSLFGTLPFIAALVMTLAPVQTASALGMPLLTVPVMATYMVTVYARIILAFMSGVFWGFATQAEGRVAAIAYAASVIPALYVFFTALSAMAAPSLTPLVLGFALLLIFDFGFWRAGLAPPWWMSLRLAITVIVLICLLPMVLR